MVGVGCQLLMIGNKYDFLRGFYIGTIFEGGAENLSTAELVL